MHPSTFRYDPFSGQPVAPDPVEGAADPAAEAAPAPAAAVVAPAPGEVCRYQVYDAYADPARDRDQIVLITGGPDETGAVAGVVLGFADAVEASFRPEDLRPA